MALTETRPPETAGEAIPQTMRALVLTGPNAFEVRDVPTPRPGAMEVLCRVEAVAICGTDVHIIEGRFPGRWPRGYPFIPGHEWSGTVVELGPGAGELGWNVGDRVAGTSHAPCGYCRMCRTGRYNLCDNYGKEPIHHQYGHYSQGADAQYVVHSVRSVYHLPGEIDLPLGAMVDTASIALHSVKRPGIEPGDTAVVVGAGPMGMLTGDCALALGAAHVIVTGSGERLDKARELGFDVINYREEDPVAAVKARTGGRGADVAIDTGGTVSSIRQSVDVVRKGGRVSFTGVPTEPVELPMQKIVLEEIDLHGVRANPNAMDEAIALIVAGRIRVKPLATNDFPLEQYGEALHTFAERVGGAMKVLVHPNW